MLDEKRIRIITGHYGSGKTEFAVNYAMGIVEINNKTALVDLDIVNPYFRSREVEPLLNMRNIRVVASSLKGSSLDVPAISSEAFTILQDRSYQAILDVGGDGVGARVLARYHEYLDVEPYEMFFVLNGNRPMTRNVDSVVRYIRSIEEGSRQKVTSIINNTHLCEMTTIEDILRGQVLCEKVSEVTELPIKYTVVHKKLFDELNGEIKNKIFPISIYMKKPWEE